MHEMSVALEVCRLAEDRAGVDGRVVTVGVEVGDDAGVEIGSLEFCLEAVLAAAGPPLAGARAVIERRAGDVLRLSYLEVEDDDDPHD
jgi:Zn finger protein HypA/HybF involved in hydrogenase expression